MTVTTGPWLWETSGKPFLRRFTFTYAVESKGPQVMGTEPYIMNHWSTWNRDGTWVTWRSTASRFTATVCTLTRMQSRTWFCSWTTRTLRDHRTLLCCSCWRSGTGWTGFHHLGLSRWTSSPACCATDSNCPPRTLPGSKQRCRRSAPSSPNRWSTKQPNYVAKNRRAEGLRHRLDDALEQSWGSGFGGVSCRGFHCRHGSQLRSSYLFGRICKHCRFKEDFTMFASLLLVFFFPGEINLIDENKLMFLGCTDFIHSHT